MATIDVALTGEVDIARVAEVRQVLHVAIDAAPGGTVRVDLRGLDFIDSTGLGALVGAKKKATATGTRLLLCAASPSITKLFSITGLDKVLELEA